MKKGFYVLMFGILTLLAVGIIVNAGSSSSKIGTLTISNPNLTVSALTLNNYSINTCTGSSLNVCVMYMNLTTTHSTTVNPTDFFQLSNSADDWQLFRWENNSWVSYYWKGYNSKIQIPTGTNQLMIRVWKAQISNTTWEVTSN